MACIPRREKRNNLARGISGYGESLSHFVVGGSYKGIVTIQV